MTSVQSTELTTCLSVVTCTFHLFNCNVISLWYNKYDGTYWLRNLANGDPGFFRGWEVGCSFGVVCPQIGLEPRSIYPYSNLVQRLSGQTSISGIVFLVFQVSFENWETLEKWPESLGAMLKYWYIKLCLLKTVTPENTRRAYPESTPFFLS